MRPTGSRISSVLSTLVTSERPASAVDEASATRSHSTARLDRLEELHLSDTAVTDAELAYLRRLRRLSRLDLTRTQVTDAGLEYLAGLTELASLYLRGTRVSHGRIGAREGPDQTQGNRPARDPRHRRGAGNLMGLTNLAWIDLRDTNVTDAGIEGLPARPLPRLYVDR